MAWAAAGRWECCQQGACSQCSLGSLRLGGTLWAGLSSVSETSHFCPRRQDLAKGLRWIVLKSRNCPIYPKNLLEKHILFYLIHSAR